MSKDIETIEEVLRQLKVEEYGTLPLPDALAAIQKIIERDVIGKDDFSTYEHDQLRNVVGRIRNTHRNEQRQALTNALYGKGEDKR